MDQAVEAVQQKDLLPGISVAPNAHHRVERLAEDGGGGL